MRFQKAERCANVYENGSRCERKKLKYSAYCERCGSVKPALNGPYATTADFMRALGAGDHEAEMMQARIERLAGNKPKAVK